MKEKSITVILSIILEIIISYFVPKNHYFLPLIVFFTTMIEVKEIKKNKDAYLFSFFSGFIYDMVLNTYLLNAVVFLIITWLMKKIEKYIDHNVVTILFLFFIELFLYRFITFFILIIIQYQKLDWFYLMKSILSSILLNLIFYLCYTYKKKTRL